MSDTELELENLKIEKEIIIEEYVLSQIIRTSKGFPLFIVSNGMETEQFTVASIYSSVKQSCWSINLRCIDRFEAIITNKV